MSKKVILMILDGFGVSALEEGNAVMKAKTPVIDSIWASYPKTILHASGEEVGLSWGEMGNSEVGHLNIGTGRISQQDLPRINKTIEDGSFFSNEFLLSACDWAKKHNSTLHLLGLLSNGGVHADVGHLLALIKLAKERGIKKVAIHLVTDGRDMPKQSAGKLIAKVNDGIKIYGGVIASLIGRFWAMDRDNNWDRIQKAYDLLVQGAGEKYSDAIEALNDRYKKGEDDEKLSPISLDADQKISDNDAVIFFNFRSDRAKELTNAFIDKDLKTFSRAKYPKNLRFITFTSYGNEQSPLVDVAYLADKVTGQLAQIVSQNKLLQLHAAETEKYAHVTYFLNGGVEKEFVGEKRILVPSPKVDSYDKKPEMSAREVTSKFISMWNKENISMGVINYANPDMVGHTGNLNATIKAVEFTDRMVGEIVKNVGEDTSFIITSDHGNAEQMIDPQTKEIDKQHSTNSVPFTYIQSNIDIQKSLKNAMSIEEKMVFFSQTPTAVLADIAPTVLNLLDLKKPREMSGINLKDII